jgi:hypothetical protein
MMKKSPRPEPAAELEIKVKSAGPLHKCLTFTILSFKKESCRSVKITGIGHAIKKVLTLATILKSKTTEKELFLT